ncbi:MAG: DUF2252 domain-containing protein [Bacteroidetes bacterium]|nr:MAG: DUF2252 domain-containing protein [Bacteroidota bacterium]
MHTNVVSSIENYLAAHRKEAAFELKLKAIQKNAFSFFRGTCHLYYQYLQQHPYVLPKSPLTWLCGDLHIENFGTYKAANGITYFDINDFDEGTQGPLLIDIARLLTSLEIALEQLDVSAVTIKKHLQYFLQAYSTHITAGKATDIEANTASGVVDDLLEQVAKRSEEKFVATRVQATKKGWQLLYHEKCWPLEPAEKKKYKAAFGKWVSSFFTNKYELVDVGYRIAGTGSLGVPRYLLLLKHSKKEQLMLLDAKLAVEPASYMAISHQIAADNHAERIAITQFRMQHEVPNLLTAATVAKQHFVIKKLQPSTDKLDWEQLVTDAKKMKECVHYIAITTANAQLRSSGRAGAATADELAQFASQNHWHKQLLTTVQVLANNVHANYAAFKKSR